MWRGCATFPARLNWYNDRKIMNDPVLILRQSAFEFTEEFEHIQLLLP